MDDIIYYNDLYDLYSGLLTEKQRLYFENYYFDNLSFAEMAENYNVSRNAVFKQLKITKDRLEEYERILKLLEKKKIVEKIVDNLEDKTIKAQLDNLF